MPYDLLLVVLGFSALALGYSVGITLGGVALLFASLIWMFGGFDGALFLAIPSRLFGIMTNSVLLAVPLFVLMGLIIERAGLADELFAAINSLLGRVRGGLSLSVTLVGTLLAASTGIVGASVVTLGLLALPALIKRGVEPGYAGASIAAAGTLGQIIPPAIVLIVLADQMSNAYQQVQLQQGNFAPQTLSVADVFAASLVPGLILAVLFAVYQWFKGGEQTGRIDERSKLTNGDIVRAICGPLALIFFVLGSILGGVATPSEASAVGAVGALLLASLKVSRGKKAVLLGGALLALCLLLFGRSIWGEGEIQTVLYVVSLAVLITGLAFGLLSLHQDGILQPALEESVHLVSMIFIVVIGTSIFALVFRGFGGDETVRGLFDVLPGGAWGGILIVLFVIFLLGFFLEFIEITYLVVPIVMPVLLMTPFADGSAVDPLWLAVAVALVLQTSFLTPPFGVALFYLKSVAPKELTTLALYRGVVPFVALQLLALALILAFPDLTRWLPNLLLVP